jgi:SagB-type dehydrogenase family enzyme
MPAPRPLRQVASTVLGRWIPFLALALVLTTCVSCAADTVDHGQEVAGMPSVDPIKSIKLPEPRKQGSLSVEEAIQARRSIREYIGQLLSLGEVGQLLWSAQGVTSPWGARAAPSAGATYPLELYVVAGTVEGLAPGVYRYGPEEHILVSVRTEDMRAALAEACLGQECVAEGAIDVVLSVVYERTTETYGERGHRYVHLEAGHAAENLCLQAVALGFGTVPIGAFSDDLVQAVVGMSAEEQPLYVIPVGKPFSD